MKCTPTSKFSIIKRTPEGSTECSVRLHILMIVIFETVVINSSTNHLRRPTIHDNFFLPALRFLIWCFLVVSIWIACIAWPKYSSFLFCTIFRSYLSVFIRCNTCLFNTLYNRKSFTIKLNNLGRVDLWKSNLKKNNNKSKLRWLRILYSI